LRLQTCDIRFIPRKSTSTYPGGTDIATLKWVETDKPRPDTYLTDITATRVDPVNGENGDLFVGYFKPVHKSLDGTNTTNENYFMIVNALYGNDTVSTFQNIRMHFNFGDNATINSLLRISRLTGKIEVVPLLKENTAGNEYYFDLLLNGGEGDLFKYNDGVPFVGFPSPTSLNENTSVGSDVVLFPNPASNQINLKVENKLFGSFYTVYDHTGKSVLSGSINTQNTIIELSSLSNGIYLFYVGNSKKLIFKVIKE